MDGWMDGWVGGWNGWMDGWMELQEMQSIFGEAAESLLGKLQTFLSDLGGIWTQFFRLFVDILLFTYSLS